MWDHIRRTKSANESCSASAVTLVHHSNSLIQSSYAWINAQATVKQKARKYHSGSDEVPRQQVVKLLVRVAVDHPGEHIVQPSVGLDAIRLCGLDQ